jgi:hypothetical protein
MGQIALLTQLRCCNKKLIALTFLSIFLANTILLLLPIIRGYTIFGRGDVLSHIGWMKDIIASGHIGVSNIYPLDHILGVIFSFSTGINVYDTTLVIPVLFSILFQGSIFLLARETLMSRKQILLATLLGSILVFGYMSFAPFNQSVFLIPLTLYLFFKSKNSNKSMQFTILFLCYLVLITLYHPLSALFFIAILIIIKVTVILGKRLHVAHDEDTSHVRGLTKISNPILIATVIFCMWQAYTIILAHSIQLVLNSIGGGTDTSQLSSYSNIVISNDLTVITFMTTLFSMYGQYILLTMFVLIGLLGLIFNLIRKGEKVSPLVVMFSSQFVFFIGISFIALFTAYIVGFGRFLLVSVMFSFLIIPLLIFKDDKSDSNVHKRSRTFKNLILLALILSILILSTFNLYASPIVRLANYQVTDTELSGMDSFFHSRDDSIPIYVLGTSQFRFYDALYGRNSERVNISNLDPSPPDHFGYNQNQSWIDESQTQKYILINDIGRKSYPNLFPDFIDKWRFTANDFSRIQLDMDISKIYGNGNLEVYLVGA